MRIVSRTPKESAIQIIVVTDQLSEGFGAMILGGIAERMAEEQERKLSEAKSEEKEKNDLREEP